MQATHIRAKSGQFADVHISPHALALMDEKLLRAYLFNAMILLDVLQSTP
jgi:hypothetical protein